MHRVIVIHIFRTSHSQDLNPSALPKDLSIAVSAITFVGLALSLISLAVFIPTILVSK